MKTAYESMSHAALGLLKKQNIGFPEEPDSVMARFTKHFYDTELFFDPFVGGKFAQHYFDAHERRASRRIPSRLCAWWKRLKCSWRRATPLCANTAAACGGGRLRCRNFSTLT